MQNHLSKLGLHTKYVRPRPVKTLTDDLEYSYRCVIGEHLLQFPVKMLSKCGHRMCSECHTYMLNKLQQEQTDQQIMCPENDEECQNSFLNIMADILPDFASDRELKRLLVNCINENYGCNEQMLWQNLEDHLKECNYHPIECQNKFMGCEEICSKQEMTSHMKECMFQPIRCVHCENDICKKDMELGHEKICETTPKDCLYHGCHFKGSKKDIINHVHKDLAEHLLLLMENLELQKGNEEISKSEISDLFQQILSNKKNIATENKKINDFIEKINHKLGFLDKVNGQHQINIKSFEGIITQLHNIKSVQDILTGHGKRLSQMESLQVSTHGIPEVAVTGLQRTQQAITQQEIKMAECDLRLQCLECASNDGMLIWKIGEYARRKQEAVTGRTTSLYSQPFYTSNFGYKLCARVFLNGDGLGKDTHLSIFVVVMKSNFDSIQHWPFQHKITFQIFDLEGTDHITDRFRPDMTSTSFKRPVTEMNIASGCPLFVPQSELEKGHKYIKDDTIFFKIKVLIDN